MYCGGLCVVMNGINMDFLRQCVSEIDIMLQKSTLSKVVFGTLHIKHFSLSRDTNFEVL